MLIVGPDAQTLIQGAMAELARSGYESGPILPEPPHRSKRGEGLLRPLELQARQGELAAALTVHFAEEFGDMPPEALVHGITPRLARRLGTALQFFTARLSFGPDDDDWDLVPTHRLVAEDGSITRGPLEKSLVEEYGEDGWDDICDAKPHAAVGVVLEIAEERLAGKGREHAYARCEPPASLGEERLDALAQQIRFAQSVTLASVGGRAALRFAGDGSTSISVLREGDQETLELVFGAFE